LNQAKSHHSVQGQNKERRHPCSRNLKPRTPPGLVSTNSLAPVGETAHSPSTHAFALSCQQLRSIPGAILPAGFPFTPGRKGRSSSPDSQPPAPDRPCCFRVGRGQPPRLQPQPHLICCKVGMIYIQLVASAGGVLNVQRL
jgi:hypothetical protein